MIGAITVCALDIETPDAAARKRAAASGKKAQAHIVLIDTDEGREPIAVSPRVARALRDEMPALPSSRESVLDAIAAIEARVCFAVAVDALSRRDHAEGELARKLRHAGYRSEAVDAAIARAREMRFVDDVRFASYYIEERKRAGWGRRRIEAELSRRGIDTSGIPGYPEEFFSEDEDVERAYALIARKPVSDIHGREKLIRHLVSKGFSYGVATHAVRRRMEGSPDL